MLNPQTKEPSFEEIYKAVNERTKRIIQLEETIKTLAEKTELDYTQKIIWEEIHKCQERLHQIEIHLNKLSLHTELSPKIYL